LFVLFHLYILQLRESDGGAVWLKRIHYPRLGLGVVYFLVFRLICHHDENESKKSADHSLRKNGT